MNITDSVFSTQPSRRELIGGIGYLIFYSFLLPWLIGLAGRLLPFDWNATELNFIYFSVNFLATVFLLRKYLLRSLKDALKVPLATIWYTLLGYLGSRMLNTLVSIVCLVLYPGFANVNDLNTAELFQQDYRLMLIGTVFLAPVAEELLFRGVVFRGLYDRKPWLAHVVSMALFSAIHVVGYIGVYAPKVLLLCFLQYLPVAYCLNFAYRRSGTIVAPILLHIVNNLAAVSALR